MKDQYEGTKGNKAAIAFLKIQLGLFLFVVASLIYQGIA